VTVPTRNYSIRNTVISVRFSLSSLSWSHDLTCSRCLSLRSLRSFLKSRTFLITVTFAWSMALSRNSDLISLSFYSCEFLLFYSVDVPCSYSYSLFLCSASRSCSCLNIPPVYALEYIYLSLGSWSVSIELSFPFLSYRQMYVFHPPLWILASASVVFYVVRFAPSLISIYP
jgi:hypothetical protein